MENLPKDLIQNYDGFFIKKIKKQIYILEDVVTTKKKKLND